MTWYGQADIRFPNIGITLDDVPMGIDVFGFNITIYGIIIAIGMLAGFLISDWQCRRTGQKSEDLVDFAFYAIILSVIGARIYYVIFHFESFRDDPIQILNIRTGGLAIYGGIITAVIILIVFCRTKKLSLGLFSDTAVLGLITGQIIGRFGNFFNREAFGKYTDGILAMQIDLNSVNYEYRCSDEVLLKIYKGKPDAMANIIEQIDKMVRVDGRLYIQAHPTFLYESLWNLVLLVFLLIYSKHKKFNGEIILIYFLVYGIGRFWMEGLRTDQLFIWDSSIPVSQLVSAIAVLVSGLILIRNYSFKRINDRKKAE